MGYEIAERVRERAAKLAVREAAACYERSASGERGEGERRQASGAAAGGTASKTHSLRPTGALSDEEVEAIEELAEEIGTLAAHIHAAEHQFLELIAEFDRREGWKLPGYRNCSEWLHVFTGLDRRTARERVRVARKLEDFPLVSEAMRRGQLSFSKVRAIVRLPLLEAEHQRTIIEFARANTAAELEKLIRSQRKGPAASDQERERQRHAKRRLAIFCDESGSYEIRGTLDPEVGALLMRAVEAASDALYDVERQEPLGPEPPEPEQRRADALGLLAERALAVGFGNGGGGGNGEGGDVVERYASTGPAGPRNGSAKNTGGTDQLSENGPAGPPRSSSTDGSEPKNGPAGPLSGTRAERYQVFVHLERDTRAGKEDSLAAHLEDGTRLAPETALRLTCDASIVGVVQDEKGSVLDIGRKSRAIPPAIRRALQVRDGGCRFPGCGLRFTAAHHIHHWVDGGPTDMDNLVSLCRFHHRAVHDDGFRVQSRGEGSFKFFSPEGWPLGTEPPCVEVDIDDPAIEIVRRNRRRGIRPSSSDTRARHRSEAYIPKALLYRAMEAAAGG